MVVEELNALGQNLIKFHDKGCLLYYVRSVTLLWLYTYILGTSSSTLWVGNLNV